MAVNPYGLVMLNDFGNPKVFSAKAIETISGGWFVSASGAADAVSSGADSFATEDIVVAHCTNGSNFVGIALNTVASGGKVAVAIDGMYIVRCGENCVAGQQVTMVGTDAVAPQLVIGSNTAIGRALTEGASGNFCVALMYA